MIRLEFLRRAKGLTQGELGEAILYSHGVISGLERGRPAPETVGRRLRDALERFFGESLESLMSPVTESGGTADEIVTPVPDLTAGMGQGAQGEGAEASDRQ